LRGFQDRGAFASPGESDSLAVVAGALAGYPKSSDPASDALGYCIPDDPGGWGFDGLGCSWPTLSL
jgi:hypothetical protein